MTDILVSWLNDEVGLSQTVTSFEKDFSNGYLFGELFFKHSLQSDFRVFANSDKLENKLFNFTHLEPTFKRLGIKFGSKIVNDIITEKRGAAAKLLLQLRMTFDDLAKSQASGQTQAGLGVTMPAARTQKGALPSQKQRTMPPLSLRKGFDSVETDLFNRQLRLSSPREHIEHEKERDEKYEQSKARAKAIAAQKASEEQKVTTARRQELLESARYNRMVSNATADRAEQTHARSRAGLMVHTQHKSRVASQRAVDARKRKEKARLDASQEALDGIDSFERNLKHLASTTSAVEGTPTGASRLPPMDQSLGGKDKRGKKGGKGLVGSPTASPPPGSAPDSLADGGAGYEDLGGDARQTELNAMERLRRLEQSLPAQDVQKQVTKQYMERVRAKKEEEESAMKEREKRRRKVALEQIRAQTHMQQRKKEAQLLEHLMRLSREERHMATQLLEARRLKDEICRNREFRDAQYQEQREKDWQMALERNARVAQAQKEQYLAQLAAERKKSDELAAIRAENKRRKHALFCGDIVDQMVEMSVRVSEHRWSGGNNGLVQAQLMREWKTLFVQGALHAESEGSGLVPVAPPLEPSPAQKHAAVPPEEKTYGVLGLKLHPPLEGECEAMLDEAEFFDYVHHRGLWTAPAFTEAKPVQQPPTTKPAEDQDEPVAQPQIELPASDINPGLKSVVAALEEITTPPEPVAVKPDIPDFPIRLAVVGAPQTGKSSVALHASERHGLVVLSPLELVERAVKVFTAHDAEKQRTTEEADAEDKEKEMAKGQRSSRGKKLGRKAQEREKERIRREKERQKRESNLEKICHLGELAQSALLAGQTVPDHIVAALIAMAIRQLEGQQQVAAAAGSNEHLMSEEASIVPPPQDDGLYGGWVLDGFPTNLRQAVMLEKELTGFVAKDAKAKEALGLGGRDETGDGKPKDGRTPRGGRKHLLTSDTQDRTPNTTPRSGGTKTKDKEKDTSTVVPGSGLDAIIHLTLPPYEEDTEDVQADALRRRALGRRVDPETGQVFHVEFNPPPADQAIDERLVMLPSDAQEVEMLGEKLRTWRIDESDMCEFLRGLKLLHPVDALQDPLAVVHAVEEVYKAIEDNDARKPSTTSTDGKVPEVPAVAEDVAQDAQASDADKTAAEAPLLTLEEAKAKLLQSIDPRAAKVLIEYWNDVEQRTLGGSKVVFRALRRERARATAHFAQLYREFEDGLRQSDAMQDIVDHFQNAFNAVDSAMRNDFEVRQELHQLVDDTEEKLWEVADQRRDEGEKDRQAVLHNSWLKDHAAIAAYALSALMQAELDRHFGSQSLLIDVYEVMRKKPMPSAAGRAYGLDIVSERSGPPLPDGAEAESGDEHADEGTGQPERLRKGKGTTPRDTKADKRDKKKGDKDKDKDKDKEDGTAEDGQDALAERIATLRELLRVPTGQIAQKKLAAMGLSFPVLPQFAAFRSKGETDRDTGHTTSSRPVSASAPQPNSSGGGARKREKGEKGAGGGKRKGAAPPPVPAAEKKERQESARGLRDPVTMDTGLQDAGYDQILQGLLKYMAECLEVSLQVIPGERDQVEAPLMGAPLDTESLETLPAVPLLAMSGGSGKDQKPSEGVTGPKATAPQHKKGRRSEAHADRERVKSDLDAKTVEAAKAINVEKVIAADRAVVEAEHNHLVRELKSVCREVEVHMDLEKELVHHLTLEDRLLERRLAGMVQVAQKVLTDLFKQAEALGTQLDDSLLKWYVGIMQSIAAFGKHCKASVEKGETLVHELLLEGEEFIVDEEVATILPEKDPELPPAAEDVHPARFTLGQVQALCAQCQAIAPGGLLSTKQFGLVLSRAVQAGGQGGPAVPSDWAEFFALSLAEPAQFALAQDLSSGLGRFEAVCAALFDPLAAKSPDDITAAETQGLPAFRPRVGGCSFIDWRDALLNLALFAPGATEPLYPTLAELMAMRSAFAGITKQHRADGIVPPRYLTESEWTNLAVLWFENSGQGTESPSAPRQGLKKLIWDIFRVPVANDRLGLPGQQSTLVLPVDELLRALTKDPDHVEGVRKAVAVTSGDADGGLDLVGYFTVLHAGPLSVLPGLSRIAHPDPTVVSGSNDPCAKDVVQRIFQTAGVEFKERLTFDRFTKNHLGLRVVNACKLYHLLDAHAEGRRVLELEKS